MFDIQDPACRNPDLQSYIWLSAPVLTPSCNVKSLKTGRIPLTRATATVTSPRLSIELTDEIKRLLKRIYLSRDEIDKQRQRTNGLQASKDAKTRALASMRQDLSDMQGSSFVKCVEDWKYALCTINQLESGIEEAENETEELQRDVQVDMSRFFEVLQSQLLKDNLYKSIMNSQCPEHNLEEQSAADSTRHAPSDHKAHSPKDSSNEFLEDSSPAKIRELEARMEQATVAVKFWHDWYHSQDEVHWTYMLQDAKTLELNGNLLSCAENAAEDLLKAMNDLELASGVPIPDDGSSNASTETVVDTDDLEAADRAFSQNKRESHRTHSDSFGGWKRPSRKPKIHNTSGGKNKARKEYFRALYKSKKNKPQKAEEPVRRGSSEFDCEASDETPHARSSCVQCKARERHGGSRAARRKARSGQSRSLSQPPQAFELPSQRINRVPSHQHQRRARL